MVKEFDVNGSTIGVRFGMRAFEFLEIETKKPVSEAIADITNISTQIILMHGAVKDYDKFTGKSKEEGYKLISRDEVIDFCDHIGFSTLSETVTTGVAQYFLKKNDSQSIEEILQEVEKTIVTP